MTNLPINCSVAKSLNLFGERWSLLIIREAILGSSRFDEFHERIGIARNMLNTRLQKLVKNGIFDKQVSDHSARVFHYRLTQKGKELLPVIVSIMQWGDRWVQKEGDTPIVIFEASSGHAIKKMILSATNGRALGLEDIRITTGSGATKLMRARLG